MACGARHEVPQVPASGLSGPAARPHSARPAVPTPGLRSTVGAFLIEADRATRRLSRAFGARDRGRAAAAFVGRPVRPGGSNQGNRCRHRHDIQWRRTPRILMTSGVYGPVGRQLHAVCREQGVTLIDFEHGTTTGLGAHDRTPIAGFRSDDLRYPYGIVGTCGGVVPAGAGGKLRHSRGRAGRPDSTRALAVRAAARARQRLKLNGGGPTIMHVSTLLYGGNMRSGDDNSVEHYVFETEKRLLCDVYGAVNKQVLYKTYPTQRFPHDASYADAARAAAKCAAHRARGLPLCPRRRRHHRHQCQPKHARLVHRRWRAAGPLVLAFRSGPRKRGGKRSRCGGFFHDRHGQRGLAASADRSAQSGHAATCVANGTPRKVRANVFSPTTFAARPDRSAAAPQKLSPRCMADTISIAGRMVGQGAPCFVIAEIGINHGGDEGLCAELIAAAAESGRRRGQVADGDAGGKLPPRHGELCRLQGRHALARGQRAHDGGGRKGRRDPVFDPGDPTALRMLLDLDVPAIKISSGLLTNLPLIEMAAAGGKPLIMSTGMARMDEVRAAVDAAHGAGCREMALLQCTSLYPAPAAALNLRCMAELARIGDCPVGYSDHHGWPPCVLAAVARGRKADRKTFHA